VLKFVEGDTKGIFHGLNSLIEKKRGRTSLTQVVLYRDIKIPIPTLAESRYGYSVHRKSVITKVNVTKDHRCQLLGKKGEVICR